MSMISSLLLMAYLTNAARVPLIIDTDIGTDFDDTYDDRLEIHRNQIYFVTIFKYRYIAWRVPMH